MLSPGQFHKRVPKDRLGNLKFRLKLLRLCRAEPKYRAAVIEACRRDALFFLAVFAWQFNPTKKGIEAVGPFIPWDFQERTLVGRPETTGSRGVLWCFENDRSAVMQKSRRMGASWFFLFVQVWLGRFTHYLQALNISKSADAVDDNSPNSLFWKIRFIHRHLPNWLLGAATHRKMYVGYGDTQSVLTGEASTGRAGVGGRAGLIFVDEVSKIREAAEIRQRTANTADCRFFNSTHEGSDTEFYKLTKTPEFVQYTWHWTEHPEYRRGMYRYDKAANKIEVLDKGHQYPPDFQFVYSEAPLGGPRPGVRSPWYDRKCEEIGSARAIAIELDIDVGGSVEQFFNPALVSNLVREYCREPDWCGDVHVDMDRGMSAGLVKLDAGPLRLWIRPAFGGDFPPARYVIASDIAAGTGATPSCTTVANADTGQKVAEYTNARIPPEKFAAVVAAIGRLFKDRHGRPARAVWEMAGAVGQAFGKAFMALGYADVYYREAPMSYAGIRKPTDSPGWYPHGENKKDVLLDYAAALENRRFVNPSEEALLECLQFRWNATGGVEHSTEWASDDPSGAGLNHADHVIADALAWMLCDRHVGKRKAEVYADDPPPGSWEWRRQQGQDADREADLEWAT